MIETMKPMKVVCIFDPAIVKRIPQNVMIEYGRSRDISKIEQYFEPANMPSIYWIRRISRSVMNRYIDSQSCDEARATAAFQYGVIRIDGARTFDRARIDFEPTGVTSTSDGDIGIFRDEEMDRFSRAEHIEIGNVVYRKSFLPSWIADGYLLPPMSVELWARLEPPSVVASPITPARNSEKP